MSEGVSMITNRFETPFGSDALNESRSCNRLKPFGARYRFNSRTWGIVVWATNWVNANDHATKHGMVIDGVIIERVE